MNNKCKNCGLSEKQHDLNTFAPTEVYRACEKFEAVEND